MVFDPLTGHRPAIYETCIICATTQHPVKSRRPAPRMRIGHDGRPRCTDGVECLGRRRELIAKMERGLGNAWAMLDLLAMREGWPR